jgi:hypothetical protein
MRDVIASGVERDYGTAKLDSTVSHRTSRAEETISCAT